MTKEPNLYTKSLRVSNREQKRLEIIDPSKLQLNKLKSHEVSQRKMGQIINNEARLDYFNNVNVKTMQGLWGMVGRHYAKYKHWGTPNIIITQYGNSVRLIVVGLDGEIYNPWGGPSLVYSSEPIFEIGDSIDDIVNQIKNIDLDRVRNANQYIIAYTDKDGKLHNEDGFAFDINNPKTTIKATMMHGEPFDLQSSIYMHINYKQEFEINNGYRLCPQLFPDMLTSVLTYVDINLLFSELIESHNSKPDSEKWYTNHPDGFRMIKHLRHRECGLSKMSKISKRNFTEVYGVDIDKCKLVYYGYVIMQFENDENRFISPCAITLNHMFQLVDTETDDIIDTYATMGGLGTISFFIGGHEISYPRTVDLLCEYGSVLPNLTEYYYKGNKVDFDVVDPVHQMDILMKL